MKLKAKDEIRDFSLGLISPFDGDSADIKRESVQSCLNVDFIQGGVAVSKGGVNAICALGEDDLINYKSSDYVILGYKEFRLSVGDNKLIKCLVLRKKDDNEIVILCNPYKRTNGGWLVDQWTNVFDSVQVNSAEIEYTSSGIARISRWTSSGTLLGYVGLDITDNPKCIVTGVDANYNIFFGLPRFMYGEYFTMYSSYAAYLLKTKTTGADYVELKYIDVIDNALRIGIYGRKFGEDFYLHLWLGWISWYFYTYRAVRENNSTYGYIYRLYGTHNAIHKGEGLSLELRDFYCDKSVITKDYSIATIYDNKQFHNGIVSFSYPVSWINSNNKTKYIKFRELMGYNKRATGFAFVRENDNKLLKGVVRGIEGQYAGRIYIAEVDSNSNEYEYGDNVLTDGRFMLGAGITYGASYNKSFENHTLSSLLNISNPDYVENRIEKPKMIESQYVYGSRCYAVISDANYRNIVVFSHLNGFGGAQFDLFPFKYDEIFGYFTVSDKDEVCVAVTETVDRDLLIFTNKSTYVYSIQSGSKYVIKTLTNLSNTIGIANKNAFVKTSYGVFWCDANGIYRYLGGIKHPENIALNRVLNLYRKLVNLNEVKLGFWRDKSEVLVFLDKSGYSILAYEVLYNRWKMYGYIEIGDITEIVGIDDDKVICRDIVYKLDIQASPYNSYFTTQNFELITDRDLEVDRVIDEVFLSGIIRDVVGMGISSIKIDCKAVGSTQSIFSLFILNNRPPYFEGTYCRKVNKGVRSKGVYLTVVLEPSSKQLVKSVGLTYYIIPNKKRGYSYV